ncbi:MAG: DUF2092 domain-containing protein [Bacteroidota bacterium]
MRKLFICLLFIGLFTPARSQEKTYDTIAVVILDHMSAILGDLSSCRFKLDVETDLSDPDLGVITNHETSDVSFSGPDKMLMHIHGDKGHRGYWYNGKMLTWYSFSENNYVIIEAPDNIIAMFDTINKTYGIDFPAADFFYPTLTDDLIDQCDLITFQGKTQLNDKTCLQIVAKNKEMTVQFWVSEEAMFLPMKMVISYNENSHIRRYEATFSDWQINPGLPDTMFDFSLPPGAHEVSIQPKK